MEAFLRYDVCMSQIINIRVIPKASSSRIIKEQGIWRVYVTSVPEDGKANKAVIKLLAKEFGVAKSKFEIISGETSRDKMVKVEAEIALNI